MGLLVSIIIPCYNQAEFIEDTLKSVFDQTYQDWECLLIDDGSTDDTAALCEKWVRKDSRFRYYKKENSGVCATRNYGLKVYKGDYIQFLDGDDCIHETKLEKSIKQVIASPEINMVFTNFEMFTHSVKETRPPYCDLKKEYFTKESVLYLWNEVFSIPIHCGFIKREILNGITFPIELTAQEDWFFWITVFGRDVKVAFIDSALAFYRINPKSRTFSKSILNDQMKVYEMFKEILNPDEFDKLSRVLIKRYYTQKEKLILKNAALKKSNTYQGGLMIKKILKKIGVLSISRKIFKKIGHTFKK